jgi:hypothetical protein
MQRRMVLAVAALLPASARRLSFVLLTLTLLPILYAQEFRGTVTGRVVDTQSAAIPNAKIVATLVATGAQSVTNTGLDGQFTIPFLSPGTYRVVSNYVRKSTGLPLERQGVKRSEGTPKKTARPKSAAKG